MPEHRMPNPFDFVALREAPIEEVLSRNAALNGVAIPEYITAALESDGVSDDLVDQMFEQAFLNLGRAADQMLALWRWYLYPEDGDRP